MAIKKKSSVAEKPTSERQKTGDVAWEDVESEFTPTSVLMDVIGDTGTGRSRLALTAPGPMAYIHTNEKIRGLIEPFAKLKKIKTHCFAGTFFGTTEAKQKQAMEQWRAFRRHYLDAYNWARTIVIDSDTELWELIRLAFFGDFKPSTGRLDVNWGPVNAEWMSLIKHYRSQSKTNLILIGQCSDEYTTTAKGGKSTGMGERTGRTIRAGQKKIPYLADVSVRTRKAKGEFTLDITKGWFHAEYEGEEVFENKDITFAKVMALVTETEERDWK